MHPKMPGRHIYIHCQQKTGVMILSKFNFKMSCTINFKVFFVQAHTKFVILFQEVGRQPHTSPPSKNKIQPNQ